MKKFGIGLGIVLLLILGGFLWLLSGASADNASKEEVVVDLPDTFER